MSGDSLELEGKAAPPTANGELVFEFPWQSRVFGMARSMCESGYYQWDEFRTYLISEIESWDRNHSQQEEYNYYAHFFSALEKLLADKDLCLPGDLAERTDAFRRRPHGHDH